MNDSPCNYQLFQLWRRTSDVIRLLTRCYDNFNALHGTFNRGGMVEGGGGGGGVGVMDLRLH